MQMTTKTTMTTYHVTNIDDQSRWTRTKTTWHVHPPLSHLPHQLDNNNDVIHINNLSGQGFHVWLSWSHLDNNNNNTPCVFRSGPVQFSTFQIRQLNQNWSFGTAGIPKEPTGPTKTSLAMRMLAWMTGPDQFWKMTGINMEITLWIRRPKDSTNL